MSTCPDCKNQFSQPFLCVTCGAEKLYDATLEAVKVELAALRSKVAEARAEGMEEAAKVCDEVAANPSPMWEEAEYCWEHAAKDCAAAIRAKMKEIK